MFPVPLLDSQSSLSIPYTSQREKEEEKAAAANKNIVSLFIINQSREQKEKKQSLFPFYDCVHSPLFKNITCTHVSLCITSCNDHQHHSHSQSSVLPHW